MFPLPSTWNVPYDQNPLFTGRDDVLKALHDAFIANKATGRTPPQAITGLGGIGKTQIAIEYTYRYATVQFTNGSGTVLTLINPDNSTGTLTTCTSSTPTL